MFDALDRRRKWSLRIFVAEVLGKRWMETLIPWIVLIIVSVVTVSIIPGYLGLDNLSVTARQFGEFGFVGLAMAVVLIGGGIDLSVGAIFALVNFLALYLFYVSGLHPIAIIGICIVAGAVLGAFNGFLVGFLRARSFLTTMSTLIIGFATERLLLETYATDIASSASSDPIWEFIGSGSVLGVPLNVVVFIVFCVVGHFLITRSRYGWRLTSVGAGRRAALHSGVPIRTVVFSSYVVSGVLCSVGAIFYAARMNSAGSDTGVGLEILALTAVVLGGISLSGGKGSTGRAALGIVTIMIVTNTLVRVGVTGGGSSFFLGLLLLFAVSADVKWLKHVWKVVDLFYTAPSVVKFPNKAITDLESDPVFRPNSALMGIMKIGFHGRDFTGQEDIIMDDRQMRLVAPEDVAIDDQNRVYTGTSTGLIMRYSGPALHDREVFCRTGGQVRGMTFDREGNLITCVAGIGLMTVSPNGSAKRLSDETPRTIGRVRDDSRLLTLDDLDIASDGRIFFTEGSTRYNIDEWLTDSIEVRPNGRILVFDPKTGKTRTLIKNLVHPGGICIALDGQSFLYSETWLCRISRYYFAGPKAGRKETVVDGLPGYPDNINPSSDGGYWVALVAMRTPVSDIAMGRPRFRKRMTRKLPVDNWLLPNFNAGCVLKLSEDGKPLETLWDLGGTKQAYSTITSAVEDRGHLYIGGIFNVRVGRVELPGSNPDWVAHADRWGAKQ
jgi:ribose transport system permease protein